MKLSINACSIFYHVDYYFFLKLYLSVRQAHFSNSDSFRAFKKVIKLHSAV